MSTMRTVQKHLAARRQRRLQRVRRTVVGSAERPRLAVFRSNKQFYCQMIDDLNGATLAAASTQDKTLRSELKGGGTVAAAAKVGERIAAVAKEKGIAKAVLDRRHYKYHGRVRAFADAARKGGLQF